MTPEHGEYGRRRRRHIPEWARRERASDMAWIRENLHVFVPAATLGFDTDGRGAIIVDTTQQPVEGRGNPFVYLAQVTIDLVGDDDVKRIVAEYDPQEELVVVLLKPQDRTSAYRIQPLQRLWTRPEG